MSFICIGAKLSGFDRGVFGFVILFYNGQSFFNRGGTGRHFTTETPRTQRNGKNGSLGQNLTAKIAKGAGTFITADHTDQRG
ncbi:hypothetical protein SBV1_2590022 [Verrucomicrobia bacterium]|nr:hypothetical protein SBV1_2590022 [Verrucomicrobiota bacterium]